jgi:hypothetical protein
MLPGDEFAISKDEFKGTVTAKAVIWSNSQETNKVMGYLLPKFIVTTNLYREVGKNRKDALLKVSVQTDMMKEALSGKAFIKIDDRQYDLAVQKQSFVTMTVSSAAVSSSGSSASVSTLKLIRGEITIPQSVGEKITDDSKVVLRLYSAEEPITIQYSSKNIKNMVKLFAAK